ncbi:feruloyl esterase [Actinoplanes sp. OR16]|uniref:tannase/feruloyl esterase family alpha/beta hydrolase n=1 Tax=Actinoplanes sp. OR16 TaxID=946334 RepID=UPI000F70E053|nr:tannase/feruloyl esterase family alpha/beta hydrolase [Actinoplanes sp. OR16]BBH67893.1 feruloyl esterase [Actinoplanes sp. OR16]
MSLFVRGTHRRRTIAAAINVFVLMAALVAASTAQASPRPAQAPVAAAVTPPAITCAQAAQLDLTGVPGAPANVTSATIIAAAGNTLGRWEACSVKGIIAPQIQFNLLLPTQTWTGRYLQTGCGGFCGSVSFDAQATYGCLPLTDGEFAVAADNEGHVGAGFTDGLFGADPQLRVDFGYRSQHLTSLVAKEIIKRFYGRSAARSYFTGCSEGGDQAMTEAQRYPGDFDGIVAGAPASNMTALAVFDQAWNAKAVLDANGNPTLTVADLASLHTAVVNACDTLDGTQDGLISDSQSCSFDPKSIACPASGSSTSGFCLTPAQVASVRKVYGGARDEKNRLLYPGAQPRGSELDWAGWLIPWSAGGLSNQGGFAVNTVRWLAYPGPRPSLTLNDITFTEKSFKDIMGRVSGIYDSIDPDLSAFRKRGGKLIMWHGEADPAVPPAGTIAYYQAVTEQMDGLARTQEFARLFMLPGVAHCSGGEGPDKLDALTAVVDWVERGKAPESLTTTKVTSGAVTATRPAYPWPLMAVNTTGGPADQASSYTAQPRKSAGQTVSWLGSFRSGYEKTCEWINGRWVCRNAKA